MNVDAYPRSVKPMLMSRSTSQPFSAKTPNGGRRIAKMILQISEQVKGMIIKLFTEQKE